MTFIDFFSGVGGFTRGLELAGHKCIGHCEIDKFAEASYRSMHTITEEQRAYLNTLDLKARQKEILREEYLNGEWYANDIMGIKPGDIPRADIWCAGFPCQDISIAGKQLGFNGQRSSLFFTVMEHIKELPKKDKPQYIILENVKNLISVNRGFDFAKLLVTLDEGGYDAEWKIINSKDHGVPQNRERIFIIGHFRGRGRREVFFKRDGNQTITELQGHQDTQAGEVANTIDTKIGGGLSRGTYPIENGGVVKVGGVPQTLIEGNVNPSGKGMNGNVYNSEGLSPTLTTNKGEGVKIVTNTLKVGGNNTGGISKR